MRRALYIGRFQPIHLGHLDVVAYIAAAADVDAVLVAIGSSQYDCTCKSPEMPWGMNPFTAAERREMIERALEGHVAKPVTVYAIPDTHACPAWYDGLVAALPAFACLYTSSRREVDLFRARGVDVRPFPRVRSFHAGSIRDWMEAGDARWRLAAPARAIEVLDRIGAEERVRGLYARDREVAA